MRVFTTNNQGETVFRTLLMIVAFGVITNAATISCGTVTAISQPCTNGDKVFDNFTFAGNVPANGEITVTEAVPNRVYVIDLTGLFTTSFVWAYDVTVDPRACSGCAITHVGYGITGLPSPAPRLQSTFGGFVGAPTNGNQFDAVPPTTNLHVVNTFSANGGFATRISNTIVESTPIPEGLPLGMVSTGLMLIASLRRRF